MKRTVTRLKSKGFHTHRPIFFGGGRKEKFDRNYVARRYGDVCRLPFSRGSKGLYGDDGPSTIDDKAEKYLPKYIYKQIGRQADDVFHDYARIGWNNTHDMFNFWKYAIIQDEPEYFYHVDDEGRLRMPTWHEECDNISGEADTEEEADEARPKPVRRCASHKRLCRCHLEHNEAVRVPATDRIQSGDATPELMGTFYVEYQHKVLKLPVYHLNHPLNPPYKRFCQYSHEEVLADHYLPVTILGRYRRELKFEEHHWETKVVTTFNKKAQRLEAEVVNTDNGYRRLIPRVKKEDLWALLNEAAK